MRDSLSGYQSHSKTALRKIIRGRKKYIIKTEHKPSWYVGKWRRLYSIRRK